MGFYNFYFPGLENYGFYMYTCKRGSWKVIENGIDQLYKVNYAGQSFNLQPAKSTCPLLHNFQLLRSPIIMAWRVYICRGSKLRITGSVKEESL